MPRTKYLLRLARYGIPYELLNRNLDYDEDYIGDNVQYAEEEINFAEDSLNQAGNFEDNTFPPREKKVRHRKKLLFQQICSQMEFYFSDSNLRKDHFLSKMIKDNGEIEISVFMTFKKIRALTNNENDVVRAVQLSDLIGVSEDNTKVFRKTPVEEKENEEDCTIYVEGIPPMASVDWLRNYFSRYGKIDHMSLPRFKKTLKNKGFGFVEFDKPESSTYALEAFRRKGCVLPTNVPTNLQRGSLHSVKTSEVDPSEADPGMESVTEKSQLNSSNTSLPYMEFSTQEGGEKYFKEGVYLDGLRKGELYKKSIPSKELSILEHNENLQYESSSRHNGNKKAFLPRIQLETVFEENEKEEEQASSDFEEQKYKKKLMKRKYMETIPEDEENELETCNIVEQVYKKIGAKRKYMETIFEEDEEDENAYNEDQIFKRRKMKVVDIMPKEGRAEGKQLEEICVMEKTCIEKSLKVKCANNFHDIEVEVGKGDFEVELRISELEDYGEEKPLRSSQESSEDNKYSQSSSTDESIIISIESDQTLFSSSESDETIFLTSESDHTLASTEEECGETTVDESSLSSEYVSKRKRRRRSHKKKKVSCEFDFDYRLKVLPKREWVKLRKLYLTLQRESMGKLKQQIRAKKSIFDKYLKNSPVKRSLCIGNSSERTFLKPKSTEISDKPKLTDTEKDGVIRSTIVKNEHNDDHLFKRPFDVPRRPKPRVKGPKFTPGVILHIQMEENPVDPIMFQNDVKSIFGVAYVDVTNWGTEAYIRCLSRQTAVKLLRERQWESAYILTGEEEREYWRKIMNDRKERFDKTVKSKLNGRRRVLKQAETALGKHIRFDD